MKQGKSNAPLTDDLDSLFYSEIGVHNKTVLNELIEEHMVLDDPTNLAAVITSFQEEIGCHVNQSCFEK